MSRIEELKEQIHAIVDAEQSEQALEHIYQTAIQQFPRLSPSEEARFEAGMKDLKEGKYISIEEFLESGRIAREERRIRYGIPKHED